MLAVDVEAGAGIRLAGVEVLPAHDDVMPVALLEADLRHADHGRLRIGLGDGLLSLGHGRERAEAQVARLGVVEIDPQAAIGRPLLGDLHRVAEGRLEQLVGIGVDPERNRAAPAPLLERDIPLGREEDAAAAGEHVEHLQGAAMDALAFGDAKDLGIESLLEGELALLDGVVEARGQRLDAAAEIRARRLIE